MITDLFFPQGVKCFVCGIETSDLGICDSCYAKLPFIKGNICQKCGGEKLGSGKVCLDCKGRDYYFHKNYSIFHYEDNMQKYILSFKNGGRKYLGETFSKFIKNYLRHIKLEFDIIIPVPIHKNRIKERGFNQSEVLCQSLDEFVVDNSVFKRVKDTPHQTGLNRENREENLEGAFEVVSPDKIKDKKILLIDDIYTTGSTINECAKELLKSGATSVNSLCLARARVNKLENIVEV